MTATQQVERIFRRPINDDRTNRRSVASALTLLLALLLTGVPSAGRTQGTVTFRSPEGRTLGMGLERTPPTVIARSPRFLSRAGVREELPRRVVLTEWLPPVGNQGQAGSCASWAAGYYCYSYAVAKQRKLTPEQRASPKFLFSPAFLFHQYNGGENKGTSMPVVFDLLAQKGCATLAEMPYSDQDFTSKPSPEAFARAEKYKVRSAGLLAEEGKVDLGLLKTWLAEVQTPLVFAIPIHADFPSKADDDLVYTNATDKVRGYHAITCVGYDSDKKAFRLLNSWGSGWGDHGFLWVSEEFVTKQLLEAWGQAPGGVIARDPEGRQKVSRSISLAPPPPAAPKQTIFKRGD